MKRIINDNVAKWALFTLFILLGYMIVFGCLNKEPKVKPRHDYYRDTVIIIK